MEWTRHTLLSWFPDTDPSPDAGPRELPEEFEIDSYWHWLVLPDPPPMRPEDEGDQGSEDREPQDKQPVTTFVFGFDNGEIFGRFVQWLESQETSSEQKAEAEQEPGDDPLPPPPPSVLPNFYVDEQRLTSSAAFSVVTFSTTALVPAILSAIVEPDDKRPFDRVLSVGAPLHPDIPLCKPFEARARASEGLAECEMSAETVIAIIDTDIAWANARFRCDRASTRIKWFWDMDADCAPGQGAGIGREMFAEFAWHGEPSINKRLADHLTDGTVDEAAVYASYQKRAYSSDISRARPMRAAGHGTHVLDCATGADFPGMGTIGSCFPDDTPILAVQLPKLAVDETHGTFLSSYVQLALDRISSVAKFLYSEDHPPVLVNYSFGGSAGRHDGLSQLEQDFDRRIADGELATINLAAGNSYESDAHARFSGDELAEWQALTMRVQPDDGSPNFAEIWLPVGTPVDALRLIVQPPVGPALKLNVDDSCQDDDLRVGDVWELTGPGVLARVYIQSDRWPPANLGIARLKITLAVHHTGQHLELTGHGRGEPVVAGNWGLVFQSDKMGPNEEVMVWVERDDRLPGARTLARQSFLVRENDDADGSIRHDGTISDIATGCRTVSAAGFQRSDGKPASYSSEGFAQPACNRYYYPTVAGACEEAPALPGTLAAGSFSGSTSRLGGTSAATGLVTRACTPIAFGGQGVRQGIIALAGETTPDSRLGWGRIHQAIPGKPPRRE